MTKQPLQSLINHQPAGVDVASVSKSVVHRLVFSVGKDDIMATTRDWFHATAFMTRDRLIERWMETMRSYYAVDVKRVYYLSMEFLMGRTLMNSLLNLAFENECSQALQQQGVDLRQVREMEFDAALGNGGLGRLAACFLDSMATLNLPGFGYGIRYEYGMFSQRIEEGRQVEHPDNWLRYGNP
jgi:glycogen phosphorylase